jgi:hypothetical protein
MKHETSKHHQVPASKVAPFGLAQKQMQVVDKGRKSASGQLALGLLVDNVLGRQIIGHHPPGSACSCDPAQAVKHVTQAVGTLPSIFGQQGTNLRL